MKTQIRFNNHTILQTLECSPEQTTILLERHFSLPWPTLKTLGLSLWPPESRIRTRADVIAECTEPDGSVWGVRFFDILPPGYLVSPTSKWVWETATQEVPFFSNAQAVRGHHGFHAAWPEDLQDWLGSEVDHHTTKCKALVRGHGDIILGEMGFRSSKMTVMQAYVREDASALRKRYPSVTFHASSSASFNRDVPYLDFPRDVRKLAKWVRKLTLEKLGDEF